ncbi:hypothetical protein BDP81DRAFT_179981 [Colletotrichum phormii]|uniref:Uncharacterized protein n=1 Tax=Colletotrichum phormii TaxID=359342 RepID=A0AAI9ZXB3_9PEZI|nr:uncharacterized protein BDP81DRAFT_179981 [Colletotrichum phormii]KAK1639591.1 hypothetical protein BDP81DRAFT_179981 [Colletotrichum phormii]
MPSDVACSIVSSVKTHVRKYLACPADVPSPSPSPRELTLPAGPGLSRLSVGTLCSKPTNNHKIWNLDLVVGVPLKALTRRHLPYLNQYLAAWKLGARSFSSICGPKRGRAVVAFMQPQSRPPALQCKIRSTCHNLFPIGQVIVVAMQLTALLGRIAAIATLPQLHLPSSCPSSTFRH